jgi:protein SCO1
MKNKTTIRFFVIIVFAVPVLAFAAMSWFEKKFDRLPILGPVKEEAGKISNHVIEDFNLTNQDGQPVSTADWKNRIVIADFFFTHCPSVCPVMTKNLKKVQQQFDRDIIMIISFSIDPERDSVSQLKKYSTQRELDNSNWSLITGSKKEIYALARNSFLVVATDGDGGPEDFIHSDQLVLIDQQKRIRGFYKGTESTDVEQLINDIKKLENDK